MTIRARFRRWLPILAVIGIVVGFGNFVWFAGESARLGGSADSVVAGHYFVSNHGILTEVDRSDWEWSSFHGRTMLVTFPFAIAGMFFFVTRIAGVGSEGKDAFAPEPERRRRRAERLAAVEASGSVLAAGSHPISTDLGQGGPADVEVRPGGIVIHERLGPTSTILTGEIRSAVWEEGRIGGHLAVAHTGTETYPLTHVAGRAADPVIVAIGSIVRAQALLIGAGTDHSRAGPHRDDEAS